MSTWRENLELTLTQNALAGAAGIHTRIMRMPYSSEPDAISAADWQAARTAGEDGYLMVFTSVDTVDWARPGVASIVKAAIPSGGPGVIIMMHDGGGNRSETVAALPQIIKELERRGYHFATVTEALRLPSADVPATGSQHIIGTLLVDIQQGSDWAFTVFATGLIALTALSVIRLLVVVGFAMAARRQELSLASRIPRDAPPFLPDVTVIIPAYNEEAGIAATVQTMAESHYRAGWRSSWSTTARPTSTARLVAGPRLPFVRVIRQRQRRQGGRAQHRDRAAHATTSSSSSTATPSSSRTPSATRPALAEPGVGAVSRQHQGRQPLGLLGRWQHLEYVIGFNLDRRMYDVLDCMPTVPGAVGAFRREALTGRRRVQPRHARRGHRPHDGLSAGRLAGRLRSGRHRLDRGARDAAALWRQRFRWCYGTLQAMWKHRRAMLEPAGRPVRPPGPALPALFQVLLPLLAPLIDVFSIYGMLFLNPVQVGAFWLSFTALQMLIAGYALRLDGERLRPLWALPFQLLVYRQLMYLVRSSRPSPPCSARGSAGRPPSATASSPTRPPAASPSPAHADRGGHARALDSIASTSPAIASSSRMLVMPEAETAGLELWIAERAGVPRVSSRLLRIEMLRSVARTAPQRISRG